MIRNNLQRRDLEILRTIGRLRYVATHEIVSTFFATAHQGRKRLRHLSGLDLIATHRKGVPDRLPYYAWRLTARGLEVLADVFPDELFPDGLAERLADGSLHHLDHRGALTRLYLAFLAAGTGPMPDDGDVASVRAVADGLWARAAQFWWQPDGDLVLRFQKLAQEAQLVPDATLCGRHRPVRVFLELDRSTRGLARIAENLERYAWFLRHDYTRAFTDGRAPSLLYVVRSTGRKAGITDHATQILGSTTSWAVHEEKPAVAWLETTLIDPAREAAERPLLPAAGADIGDDLARAARSLYTWARGYAEQLRGEGRALPREGQEALLEVYQQLKAKRVTRHAG
jgi:hypothetical protein